jgi:hypothetical protein
MEIEESDPLILAALHPGYVFVGVRYTALIHNLPLRAAFSFV